jgi:hypothetical protein
VTNIEYPFSQKLDGLKPSSLLVARMEMAMAVLKRAYFPRHSGQLEITRV